MRLIDADDLVIRVGAYCLNDVITTREALIFKAIITGAPTVKSYDVEMVFSHGLGIKFHNVPDMMEGESAFGNNFKRICGENGITIKEVAEGTGIPKNTLYNIVKRNTKRPRGDVVQKVFEYLQSKVPELTIDDLMKEEENV